MATSGFNAGLDSSDVILSYGLEATYATVPGVQFQIVRILSEGFSEERSRIRPAEIKADGQASHALTTQVEATGSIGFGVSYGTYDDLFRVLLNSLDWTSPTLVTDASNDIDAVDPSPGVEASGNPGFTSATADKFASLAVGDWIKTAGFLAANNGFWRVISITGGGSAAIQVTGPGSFAIVDETPGSGVQTLRNDGVLKNGVDVNTLTVQKEMASNLFFFYTGAYATGGTLTAALGGFFEGSIDFIANNEDTATSSQSTGSELPAPTGRIIDVVTGIRQAGLADITFEDSNPDGHDTILQSLDLTITKDAARTQFGIGSSAARGIGRGTLGVEGTISVYFKNFSLYDLYTAETDSVLSFVAVDDNLDGYVITLPAVTLMNPSIVAGGPDTDLVAEFTLEGNPGILPEETSPATSDYTIKIERFTS
ncbi:MAG: phage tail tube protein [Nitrosopumilus sp.]